MREQKRRNYTMRASNQSEVNTLRTERILRQTAWLHVASICNMDRITIVYVTSKERRRTSDTRERERAREGDIAREGERARMYCNDNNQIKSGTKIITTSMLHRQNAQVFNIHLTSNFPHRKITIHMHFGLSYITQFFASQSNWFSFFFSFAFCFEASQNIAITFKREYFVFGSDT